MSEQYTPNLGRLCDDTARRDEDSKVEYRPVQDFPGYRVGDDGSVWTALTWTVRPRKKVYVGTRWKKMNPVITNQGKCQVSLSRDGVACRHGVHRLVLSAFVGPCPDGMEGCHNDGDGTNNRLANLRWDTHKNNEADKADHGTRAVGERGGGAKLTESQVIEIRRLCDSGSNRRDLSVRFGVNKSTIDRIVNRMTWKHISPDTGGSHE